MKYVIRHRITEAEHYKQWSIKRKKITTAWHIEFNDQVSGTVAKCCTQL